MLPPRPQFYALSTADGIPYWKIALLHLDSLASTVIQTCAYWGGSDQCRFCGIELSLRAGLLQLQRQLSDHLPYLIAACAEAVAVQGGQPSTSM